jgi:ATP phosphoribosyltransferase regulatory subunit
MPSRAEMEAQLDAETLAPPAGRTREEVIARALERGAEAAALRLDPAIAGAITKLFGISGPVKEAMAEIYSLLKAAGIELDGPLIAMDARLKTIASLGLDLSRVRFTAHFGRNMEYYTGFVFELWSRDAEGPVQVAGGGRYDTLMESLGAKSPVSAIGCALRTERLLAARKYAGVA